MSIISGKGWVARFSEEINGKQIAHSRDIVLWQETREGNVYGLIVDQGSQNRGGGRLRSAESYSNFSHYELNDEWPTDVVPAPPGWFVEWLNKDGSASIRDAVAYWVVSADGWTYHAQTSPDGTGVSEPAVASETCRFVYNPDLRPFIAEGGD